MPASFQPASPRDQVFALIVMVLVLGFCVAIFAVVGIFADDSSCDGRIMMDGKSYVCLHRGDALHCYQKECE